MACFYRITIRDVRDQFLTCLVSEICRHEDAFLEPSHSLAFGFLWDALGYEYDETSSPLAGLVTGHTFFEGDYSWAAATAKRVVSCVGLVDYRVVVVEADGKWTHMTPGGDAAQATFNVAVTDPRWLEHMATGVESGAREWESTIRSITALPTFNPAWRTPGVLALAQQITEAQEFGSLPALADALQSAGCDNESVLRHCRSPGPHVCGCWALDLVLGSRWLTSEDPEAMLRELGTEVSKRKLRLFAVACCRRVEGWAELADREGRGDDYRNAISVAERFADGTATADELDAAHDRAGGNVLDRLDDWCHGDPFEDVTALEIGRAVLAAEHIRDMFLSLEPPANDELQASPAVVKARCERLAQASFLRDLFGNVFRPAAFSPEWRTDTVLRLAQQMYESRDFSAMPILADALQDAGCDNDDILNHCRSESVHVRGCWVVDLVLGKE